MTDHTQLRKRCEVAQQSLPDAPYREWLTKLHNELLDEIERLKQIFRVNMLRAFPEKSHDEITAEIENALK